MMLKIILRWDLVHESLPQGFTDTAEAFQLITPSSKFFFLLHGFSLQAPVSREGCERAFTPLLPLCYTVVFIYMSNSFYFTTLPNFNRPWWLIREESWLHTQGTVRQYTVYNIRCQHIRYWRFSGTELCYFMLLTVLLFLALQEWTKHLSLYLPLPPKSTNQHSLCSVLFLYDIYRNPSVYGI